MKRGASPTAESPPLSSGVSDTFDGRDVGRKQGRSYER